MNKLLFKLKNALQEAVAPSDFRCINCGVDVFDELGFCQKCLKEVTFNNGKTCKRCGVAIHGEEDYCGHCAFEKTYFDRAYSPLSYEGAVQRAIVQMKFARVSTNAKVLARYLAFSARQNDVQFDVVTFVPMTKKAAKQRGYNQAQLLATYFCDILDVEPPKALLTKVKETERQESLDKLARKENLIGAFSAQGELKGKTVLVIDDVKTTGSTLNECAKALKKRGAASVVCLTVASREEQFVNELFYSA